MKNIHHLSWENFINSILVAGEKRVHRIGSSPSVEIFGDGELQRIGLWIECLSESSIPMDLQRLAFVDVSYAKIEGKLRLEICTRNRALFRIFYQLAVAIADSVLLEGREPIDAVNNELIGMAELLEIKGLLSIERQIGLIGELIVLERLLRIHGANALSAWVGPRAEPHDFRLTSREFEVKTSAATRRIHTINGVQQLVPSQNHSLNIISILLGPAGTDQGFSLPSKIQDVAEFLTDNAKTDEFNEMLENSGYRAADSHLYARRFINRRPLAVIRVDERIPALTMHALWNSFGETAIRIEAIQYDLNLEGLEAEEGSPYFDYIFTKWEM